MNPSLNSRAGTLLLIVAFHLSGLWLLLATMNSSSIVPPTPLPMVMAEMMPTPQPKVEAPRPQPEPKPQPKQTQKSQPVKETPKTTDSDKALTTPKQAESPRAQAPVANADAAPAAAPLAPAAPPAPLAPPRFDAAYLNNPPPVYPPILRRTGEEGRVMLRVLVTIDGNAGEVRLLTASGSSLFDEAAMAAVRKWRFVPARRGETAVAEWVQVPIDFKLN